jgi:hypothetical protein
VGVASNGAVVLSGTSQLIHTKTIASWVQGNVYKGNSGEAHFTQGNVEAPMKPAMLLDSQGRIVGKTHPQYADHDVDDFISVRDFGAKGDGVTDDTKALQAVFDKVRISVDTVFCLFISDRPFQSSHHAKSSSWMQAFTSFHPRLPFQVGPASLVKLGR